MRNIQDIFHQFYSRYREGYSPSRQQAKAVQDIMGCRTEAMGGHVYECGSCGHRVTQYNSCRNRHCPVCQGVNKAAWVDERSKDLLHAPYFHLVFTIPQELHPLIYQNQRLLYDVMYKTVSDTLRKLAADPKHLGAQIGFFLVLHTWSQDLHFHPHLHAVVLAGGLTKNNQWRESSKKFFIPVKVLSKVFKGKFLYYLREYYHRNRLHFYGTAQQYRNAKGFFPFIRQCYRKDWYSYAEKTFSGPLAVVKYLARYTHRIAVSDARIVSVQKDTVTFTCKDRKDSGKTKNLTLTGVEFIRRFLLHILPKGFVKIRYYGILANRNKKTKLELCRRLTLSPAGKPKFAGLSTMDILCILLGKDVTVCPSCGKGTLRKKHTFYPGSSP